MRTLLLLMVCSALTSSLQAQGRVMEQQSAVFDLAARTLGQRWSLLVDATPGGRDDANARELLFSPTERLSAYSATREGALRTIGMTYYVVFPDTIALAAAVHELDAELTRRGGAPVCDGIGASLRSLWARQRGRRVWRSAVAGKPVTLDWVVDRNTYPMIELTLGSTFLGRDEYVLMNSSLTTKCSPIAAR